MGNRVCLAVETPVKTLRDVDWSDFERGERCCRQAGLLFQKLPQIYWDYRGR